MSAFAVPFPCSPPWVAVSWGPTGSCVFVACAACNVTHAVYTETLRERPEALAEAIVEHLACNPEAKQLAALTAPSATGEGR